MVGDYNKTKKEYRGKIVSMYQIEGLQRVPCEDAKVGDVICISGLENISIGDTIGKFGEFEALPFVNISEPTVEMTFSVNDSPFAGKEGKFVTSRQLRERLFKELLKDVSLRVTETRNNFVQHTLYEVIRLRLRKTEKQCATLDQAGSSTSA